MPSDDPPPVIVTDVVRDALTPRNIKRSIVAWLMALGLVIGWCAALTATCGGCASAAHPQPYSAAEVYKLSRNAALAACTVVDVGAPFVTVEELALPIYVARAVCAVIRATPEAIGVVVRGEDTDAILMPQSSGGSL